MLKMNQKELTEIIFSCYSKVKSKNSNLVLEVAPSDKSIYQWEHCPKGDVKDLLHHCQYYYHSHPSKDVDRIREHGHFHLFFRGGLFSENDIKIRKSKKYLESNGTKDDLTHLVAIAMNPQGFPVALFTVNYWVTMGIWRPASTLIKLLDAFQIEIPNSPYSITNQFITAIVQLFKSQIEDLLNIRDQVIEEFASQQQIEQDVYYNKNLEVTSVLPLV